MRMRYLLILTIAALFCSVVFADWGQYRSDGARGGYTAESLPEELSVLWKRVARHTPHRAWVGNFQATSRMKFDWAPGVVVSDGKCFYGSSADHKVYGVDSQTGETVWEFFTGGAVRLSPAVYDGRVYVGSDDGNFYCLSADDGKELWNIQAGPEINRLVGNSSVVSRWAVRGGVAIDDGVVYFGAGNWSQEGVYIYAVDAETGRVIWVNDDSGYLTIEQPHMGAMSEGGVVAQGYLSVSDDKVFVATGRSVPAVFDRKTGRFLYFHHSRYGGKTPKAIGGGDIVVTDEVFFNSGMAFDCATGLKHHLIGTEKWWEPAKYFGFEKGWHGEGVPGSNRIVCVVGDGFVRSEGSKIHGATMWHKTYQAKREAEAYFYTARAESSMSNDSEGMKMRAEPKSRLELIEGAPVLKKNWSVETGLDSEVEAFVVAGVDCVAGADKEVLVVNSKAKKITNRLSVDGVVYALAVSEGKLFVSTDKGTVYCFADKSLNANPSTVAPVEIESPYANAKISRAAKKIIKDSGVNRGYAVDLDLGTGQLAYELVCNSDLYVVALSDDDEVIAKARGILDKLGVYGKRVQILKRSDRQTYLGDYFANLIVSEKSLAGKSAVANTASGSFFYGDSSGLPEAELRRIMQPYTAAVCVGRDVRAKVLDGVGPKGAGQWTHPLSDAANSLNSGDEIVKGPLGMLWYEDETLIRIDRHGKNPAPLFYKGVMVQIGRDAIKGVDGYNGTQMWRVEMPGLLAGMTGGSGVGATATGNYYCTSGNVVFVPYKDKCVRIDIFSGETLKAFDIPLFKGKRGEWCYTACIDGVLVGAVANEGHVVTSQHGNGGPQNQVPMERMYVESLMVFAMDAKSGEIKWKYTAKESIRNNSIAIGNGKIFFIDRSPAQMDTLLKTEATLRRRGINSLPIHPTGVLYALDLHSGAKVWSEDKEIFATTVAYNSQHDILITSYNNVGRALPSDAFNAGSRAHDGSTGKVIWENKELTAGRCVMVGDTLWGYTACDMQTGKEKVSDEKGKWKMKGTGIGCGVWVGGENIILRRSGTIGYYDLDRDTGWVENYGGARSGCWINTLPVGGIVLVPDDTQGCRCSYQNQATFALKERGVRRPEIVPVAGSGAFRQRTSVGREVVFYDTLDIAIQFDVDEGQDGGDTVVRYSLGGEFATKESPVYKGPITIKETSIISAAIFKAGRKVAVRDPAIFLKVGRDEYADFVKKAAEIKNTEKKG